MRRPGAAVLAAALSLTGATLTTIGLVPPDQAPGAPPAVALPREPRIPYRPAAARSAPVRLTIPAIGVDTAVIPVGLRPDGTVEVPPLSGDAPAGWYSGSATPGEPGPSVLLGHVDTAREGPAVFFRLRDLRPGDTIRVRRAAGDSLDFTVTEVAAYPKSSFPTARVYSPTPDPVLTLITCGGSFNRAKRSYRDNIVVYAAQSGPGRRHRACSGRRAQLRGSGSPRRRKGRSAGPGGRGL